MKDWWIRLGCFLTGYKYSLVKSGSEISAKTVKKYTSALVIVCLLWAFIGYSFTTRYLKLSPAGGLAGAVILCLIIIQVERQIILAVTRNKGLYIFRGIIALMMALIGSLIIDQVLFKEDIEEQKILMLDQKVNQVLPGKSAELKRQIVEIDSTIQLKEKAKTDLVLDVTKNPTVKMVSYKETTVPIVTESYDTARVRTTRTNVVKTTSSSISSIPNPRYGLIEPLDKQIILLRNQKQLKDSLLLTLRSTVEQEIKSKVGFLDELKVMYILIAGSNIALAVWLIWLMFLLGLELFILASKIGEKPTDYDVAIRHQMELQIRRLELMAKHSHS